MIVNKIIIWKHFISSKTATILQPSKTNQLLANVEPKAGVVDKEC